MPINCSFLWVRGWLSMVIVVIQPYILVSKLKKTKTKLLLCTDYLNSIQPSKARFIANSSSYTTTELSKLLASCLTAIKNMLSSNVKRYMRDSFIIYFGLLKIQVKFWINLKLEISMTPVCLLMMFLLFTLLYPIVWLKQNLLILLKEPSIEKARLTLHVTTETHLYFRKT